MIEGLEEGNGTPGYRALTEDSGVGLIEFDRVVFHVHGPRATRVVNGLVTNSLEGLNLGTGVYAFALSAKGRPLAEMRVLPVPGFEASEQAESGQGADEQVWVDVPRTAASDFGGLLERSVPPIFATVETAGVIRLSLLGPGAPQVVEKVLRDIGIDTPVPTEPLGCRTVSVGDLEGLMVRREAIEIPGVDLYLDRSAAATVEQPLAEAVTRHGGTPVDKADWEIARVELGLPVFGAEISVDNLPQETGQTERAVSFEKGCYTGQEVVARIHYRGHVNRVLRGVRPGHDTEDQHDESGFEGGLPLYAEGRAVGNVATVVDSPRFGPIGLAYVRTSAAPGTVLSSRSGGPASIEVCDLPFTKR